VFNIQGGNKKFIHCRDLSINKNIALFRKGGSDMAVTARGVMLFKFFDKKINVS
jgi:hypothetical protein